MPLDAIKLRDFVSHPQTIDTHEVFVTKLRQHLRTPFRRSGGRVNAALPGAGARRCPPDKGSRRLKTRMGHPPQSPPSEPGGLALISSPRCRASFCLSFDGCNAATFFGNRLGPAPVLSTVEGMEFNPAHIPPRRGSAPDVRAGLLHLEVAVTRTFGNACVSVFFFMGMVLALLIRTLCASAHIGSER